MTRNVVAGIALVFAIAACKTKGAEDETATPLVHAGTAVVTTQPFTRTIGAIGTVVARAGHAASLSAPAPARVSRVLVTTGQRVRAGQPLVELDRSAFAASFGSAEATVAASQQAYDRAQRLVQEGISPRKDLEQASADLAKARADLTGARRALQLATLTAPISGVVTRMSALVGATADVTQPLVEIADPSAVDIVLSVTPEQAAQIHAGNDVALSAGQSASGESLGRGRVADIGATVDTVSRSVTVRVAATSPSRPLRIGETLYGAIATSTTPSVVVPVQALVPEGEGFKVFVVDAASVAHGRDVTVGGRTDSLAQITKGLAAGERIVTYGAYGVDDSVKIAPLNSGTAAAPKAAKDSE